MKGNEKEILRVISKNIRKDSNIEVIGLVKFEMQEDGSIDLDITLRDGATDKDLEFTNAVIEDVIAKNEVYKYLGGRDLVILNEE